MLEKEGARDVCVSVTRGTHLRYDFKDRERKAHVLLGALTPSDRRGAKNLIATARRLVRSYGSRAGDSAVA